VQISERIARGRSLPINWALLPVRSDMHVTGTPKPQDFNAGERVAALGLIAIRALSFQESGTC
jgi:hypothetical protein